MDWEMVGMCDRESSYIGSGSPRCCTVYIARTCRDGWIGLLLEINSPTRLYNTRYYQLFLATLHDMEESSIEKSGYQRSSSSSS